MSTMETRAVGLQPWASRLQATPPGRPSPNTSHHYSTAPSSLQTQAPPEQLTFRPLLHKTGWIFTTKMKASHL